MLQASIGLLCLPANQDMELLMTESHMYLQYIKSSLSINGQNSKRSMSSIMMNVLTKKLGSSKPQEAYWYSEC